MNETQIRERLRQAVGEATYPAYLSSRVEASLKHSTPDQSPRAFIRPSQTPWLVGIGRASSLVAALLVVLLIALLVVGVHAWRAGDFNTRPAPAGQDPAIKPYQAMLNGDEQRWIDSKSTACFYVSDPNCPAETAVVTAALQQWIDDLNSTRPPARFSYVAVQMSRHLTRDISSLNAKVAAYRVKDQVGMDTAIAAALNEADAAQREKADIVASSQGTIVRYAAQVRLDRGYLLACALCQQLASQTQLSCPASQTPSCIDEIAAVRLQVETFEGDLVRYLAPDSLAATDGRLQADLFAGYVALNAMESALSAGDQVRLQAGHGALQQALSQVESDAANIAKSN
jgi:hypothetical protein